MGDYEHKTATLLVDPRTGKPWTTESAESFADELVPGLKELAAQAKPGRPRRETPRTPVLIRFEPDLLARLDAWPGAADRSKKILALIEAGLDQPR